ncbi:protein phosphatase 2C domain-containing protein [Streptomyces sp. NPDC050610]|uniref:protein phosphatase 2C domain-containing protein n=1 Tax=Streptomyces sp. NPDC050610 TaxID=3157097 RepID=UPI0034382B16
MPDTVLDGARCGAATLRAVSLRGDSARYRGEPRRDALLTARFGAGDDALVLVAVASGVWAAPDAHRAARDACEWIGGAVGRSQGRLAEDIRAGRRGALGSGLHRLTDRSYGRLRARAHELGRHPAEYSAALRCLLLPADPECGTRVFFGVGEGGLFRLRDGAWQDLEHTETAKGPSGDRVIGDRVTVDLGVVAPGEGAAPASGPVSAPAPAPEQPPTEPFRFRICSARPGDALLLCSPGLAEPLRGEPAFGERLAERWARARTEPGAESKAEPPGLAAFLADAQLRAKGYAADRTACVVWEA